MEKKPMPINPLTGAEIAKDDLEAVARMAELQVQLERDVAVADERLKAAKQRLRQHKELTFPDFLMGCGMQAGTLTNGASFKVVKFYNGKIPEEQRPEAFAWLEERDFDAIIKTNVTSAFGKGELKEAKRARDILQHEGLPAVLKRDIHYQTLRGFIREQVEAGNPPPVELFGTYIGNQVKLTEAK